MALVDSLLSAIVRADGDALVMHVGERPYVVVGTQTINISTHDMNLDAMIGMLAQLLPADSLTQLEEFGAVEHRVLHQSDDRFTVVAARGGDDIWIEIRRRRPQPPAVAAPLPEPAIEPLIADAPAFEAAPEYVAEPVVEAPRLQVPEPVYEMEAPTAAGFQAAPLDVIEPEPPLAAEAAPLVPASVAEVLVQPAAEPEPVAAPPLVQPDEQPPSHVPLPIAPAVDAAVAAFEREPASAAEQPGLPPEVQALAAERQGLLLIAGPRGSGKSTLLSALVDHINRQRNEFVITLERQIRLAHDNKNSVVSQREIRGNEEDAVNAARSALGENPDVLVVDDLVSPHMVPLLLTAASEGLLVLVSITAPSTADAVQRFIELASPEMRTAVQTSMAGSFLGAVGQTLLKKAGGGLVAAREVLLATAPVTRVIADGQLSQLPLALESGGKHGMVSFTEAVAAYVRSGTVDVREAFRKSPDRDRLLQQLRRDGVDTSVVERLA